jgi:hypothetical protein
MSQKTSWWRSWEITIDSNWIMAIAMAVLLVACGVLLIREIGHLIMGNVVDKPPLSNHFLTNVSNVMVAVFFFVLAFESRAKLEKIACVLLGTDFAGRLILDYLHVSTRLQHFATTTGSVLRQIAFTILLVAILQWFKSVVRWIPPSNSGADS